MVRRRGREGTLAGYAVAALTRSSRVLYVHTLLTLANVALTRLLASGWQAGGRSRWHTNGRRLAQRFQLPGRRRLGDEAFAPATSSATHHADRPPEPAAAAKMESPPSKMLETTEELRPSA